MKEVKADTKQLFSIITKLEEEGVKDLGPIKKQLEGFQDQMGTFSSRQEDMLESQKNTRLEIANMSNDLDRIKKQIQEVQSVVQSESSKNDSFSRIKNDSKKKRWSWGESSSPIELMEKLRDKVRELEATLSRILRERPPKPPSELDGFIAGFKECLQQQIANEQHRQTAGPMPRPSGENDLSETPVAKPEQSESVRVLQPLLEFIEKFESDQYKN